MQKGYFYTKKLLKKELLSLEMSSSVNNSTKFIIVLVEDNIHEISPIISLLVSKYSRMYQVKFAADSLLDFTQIWVRSHHKD